MLARQFVRRGLVLSSLVVGLLVTVSLGLFGAGGRAAAQPGPVASPASITVMSEATVSSQPNQAWLTVGVETTAPTAAQALAEASQAIEAVLRKLDELGITRADVQTAQVGLAPIYGDEGHRYPPAAAAPPEAGPAAPTVVPQRPEEGTRQSGPPITGYRAGTLFSVLARDLANVGPVLDGVVAAGANQVHGVRFGLRDEGALRAQATREAVAAARARAEALAAGANLAVGEVLAIREAGTLGVASEVEARPAAAGGMPIEPGRLGVRAQVQVTFALVPRP